jgi:hypothetical protein
MRHSDTLTALLLIVLLQESIRHAEGHTEVEAGDWRW